MSQLLCKRTTRGDPRGTRITPRDLIALQAIAQAQPMTTRQVQTLLGLSDDMAQRRLRVLHNHGLVRTQVTALHEQNRYTLAPGAIPTLCRLGHDSESLWIPRGIERVDLAHHEATIDVYVAVRLATARSGRLQLVRWVFEREIRRSLGDVEGVLVPDAVGLFSREGEAPFAVAFEIDMGSENPSFVAKHKGIAYSVLAESEAPMLGTPCWTVACVVAPNARRLQRLALALAQVGVREGLWHLCLLGELDSRTVLGPSWLTPQVNASAGSVRLAPSSLWPAVGTGVGTRGRSSSDARTPTGSAAAADQARRGSGAFGPGGGR